MMITRTISARIMLNRAEPVHRNICDGLCLTGATGWMCSVVDQFETRIDAQSAQDSTTDQPARHLKARAEGFPEEQAYQKTARLD